MKRKSLAFFRCMMRSRSAGNVYGYGRGKGYRYAFNYLRKHQNVKGLRPYK